MTQLKGCFSITDYAFPNLKLPRIQGITIIGMQSKIEQYFF